MAQPKRPSQGGTSTTHKGNVAEQIVAMLHDDPAGRVRQHVFLPTRDGTGRREIDVLIEGQIYGYPVRFAFECKNYKSKIEVGKIDEFVGKLGDVGIPPQYGIYVSTSGYTDGAIRRAQKDGIRALHLAGLTPDGLRTQVNLAAQSIVYLHLSVESCRIWSTLQPITPYEEGQMHCFYSQGALVGSTYGLLWDQWRAGLISEDLGRNVVTIPVPPDWYRSIGDSREQSQPIEFTIVVSAIVATVFGEVTQVGLTEAATHEVERVRIDARFTMPGQMPVHVFEEEEGLHQYLTSQGYLTIVHRGLRLPRIRTGATYYPPSERVANAMIAKMMAFERGEIPDPRPFSFDQVEGSDLSAVFEPIWAEYPGRRRHVPDTGKPV